jgi:hypothetical protein
VRYRPGTGAARSPVRASPGRTGARPVTGTAGSPVLPGRTGDRAGDRYHPVTGTGDRYGPAPGDRHRRHRAGGRYRTADAPGCRRTEERLSPIAAVTQSNAAGLRRGERRGPAPVAGVQPTEPVGRHGSRYHDLLRSLSRSAGEDKDAGRAGIMRPARRVPARSWVPGCRAATLSRTAWPSSAHRPVEAATATTVRVSDGGRWRCGAGGQMASRPARRRRPERYRRPDRVAPVTATPAWSPVPVTATDPVTGTRPPWSLVRAPGHRYRSGHRHVPGHRYAPVAGTATGRVPVTSLGCADATDAGDTGAAYGRVWRVRALLVTGVCGAARSTIAWQSSAWGQHAVSADGDSELCGWFDLDGRAVQRPALPDGAWLVAHEWRWEPRCLHEIMTAAEGRGVDTLWLSGRAANTLALVERFDGCFCWRSTSRR